MSLKNNRDMLMSNQSRGMYIQQYSLLSIPFLSLNPDYKCTVKWEWRTRPGPEWKDDVSVWMEVKSKLFTEVNWHHRRLSVPYQRRSLIRSHYADVDGSRAGAKALAFSEAKSQFASKTGMFVRSLLRIDAMCWNNFRSYFKRNKKHKYS